MPGLTEQIEAAGLSPVMFHLLGTQPEDLAPPVTLSARGFTPKAQALVFNEYAIELGLTRERAFGPHYWIPLLQPARQIELAALDAAAADRRCGRSQAMHLRGCPGWACPAAPRSLRGCAHPCLAECHGPPLLWHRLMDTLAPGTRREFLRRKVGAARAALREAADTAAIKNDPLCQHLNALALSVGAHYDIYCATEETQSALARSMRTQTDTVTKGVLDLVQSSLSSLTTEAGPQLLKAALPSMQTTLRFLKYRTIYWMLSTMAALIVISGIFSYAIGLNHGRFEGETAAQTIRATMTAGPDAASDWALLMANNNPIPALAACRKNITTDAEGRRYCDMPVSLDSPASQAAHS
jgi:hypothetical protein